MKIQHFTGAMYMLGFISWTMLTYYHYPQTGHLSGLLVTATIFPIVAGIVDYTNSQL